MSRKQKQIRTFPMISEIRKVGFLSFSLSTNLFAVCLSSPSQNMAFAEVEEVLAPEAKFIRAASSLALASACLIFSAVETFLGSSDEDALGRGRFAGGSSRDCPTEPLVSFSRNRLACLSSLSFSSSTIVEFLLFVLRVPSFYTSQVGACVLIDAAAFDRRCP